ncbi:ABC transporter substrate binding protein, partial [Sulfurimonas sp.]|uniref:ABC transporter substrate-binding protein n=1 Tax=Sulfurimonas sp. TaxID=2022749 RepID=UPI0025D28EFE
IVEFGMDSKRNRDKEFLKNRALEAKKLIDSLNPDVVITSDDNAEKYLVKPYYKDSKIPFVFCGVNWTIKEYGFPYKNMTGMIEIKPVKSIFKIALNLSRGKRAIFLGENTFTDKKDLTFLKEYAKKHSIILDSYLTTNIKDWKIAYKKAQKNYDFIILGNRSIIIDWEYTKMKSFIFKNSKIPSFCTTDWMMPYSTVGLIPISAEQGIWAANTAKAILNGYPIEHISITTNKQWNYYLNLELLNASNIKAPRPLLIKSKKYEENF